VKKLEIEKPMLYAFIISKLSLDSEDELKRHNSYTVFKYPKTHYNYGNPWSLYI